MICERCWNEATRRAHSRSTLEVYSEVLQEAHVVTDEGVIHVGDRVETRFTADEINDRIARDQHKAKLLGDRHDTFMGNAAVYMHRNDGYIVEAITPTGGLRLVGFVPTVSAHDVRLSTKPLVNEKTT